MAKRKSSSAGKSPSADEASSQAPAASASAERGRRGAAPRNIIDTRISLEPDVRTEMAEMLNVLLADSSDLAAQAKTAHWNVKGPHFIALHKLFDELYERVGGYTDEIAERIATLGATVKGRVQDAAEGTRLAPFPTDLPDGMSFVRALADSYGVFANSLREGIDQAEEAEDMVTSDLLNGINAGIDKDLWFLEAHLR